MSILKVKYTNILRLVWSNKLTVGPHSLTFVFFHVNTDVGTNTRDQFPITNMCMDCLYLTARHFTTLLLYQLLACKSYPSSCIDDDIIAQHAIARNRFVLIACNKSYLRRNEQLKTI